MRSWWQGTWLVTQRSVVENLRSKAVRAITAVLLLVSIGAVVVPGLIGDREAGFTVAIVTDAPAELAAALETAGQAADLRVDVVTRDGREAVRQAVVDGDADVGFAGDTVYAEEFTDPTSTVLVSQVVVGMEVARRLAGAGLTLDQIAAVQEVQPPRQVDVGGGEEGARAGVGFAVGVVLYLAVTFAGAAIATAVATEKSTHISEVLLAVLRPTQALTGTVLAIGAVALGQLLVLAMPFVVAANVSDAIDLPDAAAGDIVLGIVWFLLGFLLYAFVFAAAGSLVNKMNEASTTSMPINLVLIATYLIGIIGATDDPEGALSVAASLFPLSAPLVMPVRWAAGETPVWQLVVAMALTAVSAVLVALVASTAYRRALLITGRRAKLREVLKPA